MRILWFTNSPSLYKKNPKGYNGGGWISSLESNISGISEIELAISFYHSDKCFKTKQGRTTYYPISLYNSKIKKIKHNLFYKYSDKKEVDAYMRVIDDFNPDVIHIFGAEESYGLIINKTNIPVIIHIQGILNPCLNAYFAPGISQLDLIIQNVLKPVKLFYTIKSFSFFMHNTRREENILKNCKHFMGRTAWDKNVSGLFSRSASYYYCSEVLKDIFYTSESWKVKKRDKHYFVSTISKTSYKGFDVILKTAKLLKEYGQMGFEWNVFGVSEYRDWEKKLGILCKDVNIVLRGVVNSETLVKNILISDIFVHPTYIDNSPNSVCEAQILGIPVIATNVGGISSLIENGETGFLVPANDPYILAARIIEIVNNPERAAEIGKNAREMALLRHDKGEILKDLLKIYNELNYAATNN